MHKRYFFRKTEEKIMRGRSRDRERDVVIKETGWEVRDWINVVQDKDMSLGGLVTR